MDALEQFKVDGLTVKIYHDQNAESPREWDNLGTMVCWHRRYNLGDDGVGNTGKRTSRQFDTPADFQEWASRKDSGVVIQLPLYLYDHSGITMNTTGFSCPWDSGQVGWIYITREKMRKEYGCKRITRKLIERVTGYLRNEVETYDQFLTGQVYGYVVEDRHGEDVDSCWGFFGMKHVKEEATSQARYFAKEERKQEEQGAHSVL